MSLNSVLVAAVLDLASAAPVNNDQAPDSSQPAANLQIDGDTPLPYLWQLEPDVLEQFERVRKHLEEELGGSVEYFGKRLTVDSLGRNTVSPNQDTISIDLEGPPGWHKVQDGTTSSSALLQKN